MAITGKVSPSRAAALQVLLRLEGNKAHSDDLLHSDLLANLSPADTNLATALVMGVLRWQIALDALILPLLLKPMQRLAEPVTIALRLGAFQLLHMDRIPAHAAISESVELCRLTGQPHVAGMVNAILRNLTRQKTPSQPIFEQAPALATRLSHPDWLVARWIVAYGRPAVEQILNADQQEPQNAALFSDQNSVTLIDGVDPNKSGIPTEAGDQNKFVIPTEGAAEAEGPASLPLPSTLPNIDPGSRLVAEIAAAAVPTPTRILDCCAAPGGKTLILASRHTQTPIIATDSSQPRLNAMRDRIEAFAYASNVQCIRADATDFPKSALFAPTFDLILCDAPCSGTGTLARNPEIRHRLAPEQFKQQAQRQRELLTSALAHLAPGGRLIYSTCSLEPEENEQVVEAVLAQQQGISILPIAPFLHGLAEKNIAQPEEIAAIEATALKGNYLRTLPGVNPFDGFFAAVLQRD